MHLTFHIFLLNNICSFVVLPPVNIMHKEEGASSFHNVYCCINILNPDWKSKVTECFGLSLHNGAFHCPEHGL